MRARRVVALWVPGLPLQAVARDDPAMRSRPVVVTDGEIVLARNGVATAAGVTLGMSIAEAATHAPDLVCAPYDPRRVQALWDVVLDQLDTLGPLVEDAGLGCAFVDLTGTGRSERPLVRRTLATLDALLSLTARAAIADGPFVALLAARRATGKDRIALIPRGAGVAFLAPLPVTTLPLPERAITNLTLLGVRTVGAFASLRYTDIQRQYGNIGTTALALAIGHDTRPLVPRSRDHAEVLAYPFEPPVDDLTAVFFVTKTLLNGHAATLRREGLVAGGVRLALAVEGLLPVVVEQQWGLATVPGEAEADALRLILDARMTTAYEEAEPPRITGLTLTLLGCVPNVGTQLPLFGAEVIRQREAVAHLLTRLHALLGPDGVVEAVPVAAHLPEEQWSLRPYNAARISATREDAPLPLVSPLLPALPGLVWCEPAEPVVVSWWGEVPFALRSGASEEEIVAALGPYHAEGQWWHKERYARAYWLLVTADQTLHLVREDRQTGEWTRVGVAD